MSRHRYLVLKGCLLGCVLVGCEANDEAEGRFTKGSTLRWLDRCPADLGNSTPQHELRCAELDVPLRHRSSTTEGTITLPIAVLRYRNPLDWPTGCAEAVSPPVFFLEGGPGVASLPRLKERLAALMPTVGQGRDLVFFDARGTSGRSILPELTPQEMTSFQTGELGRSLQQRRVDLAAYNSIEIADDVKEIAGALGYAKILLYGVSYGTHVGLQLMRSHPLLVEGAVLDSVVPPGVHYFLGMLRRHYDALLHAVARCGEDPECSRSFPLATPAALKKLLNSNKTPALRCNDEIITLSNQQIFFTAINILAARRWRSLPAYVHGLKQKAESDFSTSWTQAEEHRLCSLILEHQARRGSAHALAHGLVVCADNSLSDKSAGSSLLPDLTPDKTHMIFKNSSELWYFSHCLALNVPAIEAEQRKKVKSAIPVLLLSGEFDAITPPALADFAQRDLSRSQHLRFPTGHGVMIEKREDPCFQSIVQGFLQSPTQPVDLRCAATLRPDWRAGGEALSVE